MTSTHPETFATDVVADASGSFPPMNLATRTDSSAPGLLQINLGQCSDKGLKPTNQDFYGALIPNATALQSKGLAVALADGISSSQVSQIASESAVKTFLQDYFLTSDAWSVRTSATKVIASINGWLHAQTQQSEYRFDKEKGYVCTFSALICKGETAHVFHVGDSRIYRLRGERLEQLSKDHRVQTSDKQSYLSRALGVNEQVEIDYQSLALGKGDYFLLCTDGVHEYIGASEIINLVYASGDDLQRAANAIVQRALGNGSDDNLTLQILRVDALPDKPSRQLQQQIDTLPLPPILQARHQFDGYLIERTLHVNSRSHVYLATDLVSQQKVVLKTPSVDQGGDPEYLERLLLEEWVARRLNSAHLLKAGEQTRARNYLYSVSEFIEGVTLRQWLIDHPRPSLETVRNLTEQIAKGLQAMHRMEILHQDLRPDNIMIDSQGTVKIIDFAGARVAGLAESSAVRSNDEAQGTALYMAPEYFLGEPVSTRSDLFSLAVIVFHMLSGRFPYGTEVAKAQSAAAQRRLNYQSVLDDERVIPAWIDLTLRKALQTNPYKRYAELSEFIYDLSHPNPKYLSETRPPLLESHPLLFWKGLSLLLTATVCGLLVYIHYLTR